MKTPLLLFSLLLCLSAFADNDDSVIVRREYFTVRNSSSISIDGEIEDAEWKDANSTGSFVQNSPVENAPVTFPTEVKIKYDNIGLYIAAKMYDSNPDSISRQLGLRDEYLNADNIRFVFDTYNTQQDGFIFVVSASGVQIDERFSDYNYNAVWKSAVKLQRDGWSCEILIPWSALRFPTGDDHDWGLQITRNLQRKFEFDQWALTPKGKANPLKYFGLLKGLRDIDPPVRLSLTPYFTTIWQDDDRFGESDPSLSFAGGMDMKLGVNEAFTVDMTLLPDFSQVQSDNVVKNLGAFEQQFQDFRPFFTEGVDLFQRNNLFYSRRIGKTPSEFYGVEYMTDSNEIITKNPTRAKLLNATKLSGRTNTGLGLGILNAFVDNTYAIATDTLSGAERKILTEPRSNYNIFVIDKQMKYGSSVYFINTNVIRSNGYRSSNVTGAGATLNNETNTFSVDLHGAVSDVLYPITQGTSEFQSTIGYKYSVMVAKTSGTWQGGIGREVLSKLWDANDMGITFENNYAGNNIFVSYNLFNPKGIFNYANVSLSANYNYFLETGKTTYMGINNNTFLQFRNFWSCYLGIEGIPVDNYDYFEPREPGRFVLRPPMFSSWMGFNSNTNKKVSVGVNFYMGRTAVVGPTIPANPWYGGGTNVTLRLSDRFSANIGMYIHTDFGDRGWVNTESDGTIVFGRRNIRNAEGSLKATYVFMKDMSITATARHYWATGQYSGYYVLSEEGILHDYPTYGNNHDFSFNSVNADIVYSWIFAPGSILSVAYKLNTMMEEQPINFSYKLNLVTTMQSPQLNQVSVRVLYYLDYQYVTNALKKRK